MRQGRQRNSYEMATVADGVARGFLDSVASLDTCSDDIESRRFAMMSHRDATCWPNVAAPGPGDAEEMATEMKYDVLRGSSSYELPVSIGETYALFPSGRRGFARESGGRRARLAGVACMQLAATRFLRHRQTV